MLRPGALVRRSLAGLLRLSMRGLKRGPHITRYAMYRRLAEFHLQGLPGDRVLAMGTPAQLARLDELLSRSDA